MQDENLIHPNDEKEIQEVPVSENQTMDFNESEINENQLIEEELEIISALNKKILALESENASMKEQNLRLQADFVNFRKRKEKEASETVVFANEGLIKQLLPVLDDFDRTLKAIEKSDNLTAIKEGIDMVAKNMRNAFQKAGLESVDSIGKVFNPAFHEAITAISVEEEEKKGLIFDEIEKGYTLREKVIRPAKVVIGE
ncbi:MAG: nucleotide exchange factor GrpE [Bacteroidia bacterium]|nr:nucleotide exchange factor GrpE [Bacteroidia bacterium]